MTQEPMEVDIPPTREANQQQNLNKNNTEKYKRNLLVNFEACDLGLQVNKKIRKVARDRDFQTSTPIITAPVSPTQSLEQSKAAASKFEVAQRRQPEPEAMDQSDSIMSLKNLSKSLNELENIQGLKRYRNIQLYEPHGNYEV